MFSKFRKSASTNKAKTKETIVIDVQDKTAYAKDGYDKVEVVFTSWSEAQKNVKVIYCS